MSDWGDRSPSISDDDDNIVVAASADYVSPNESSSALPKLSSHRKPASVRSGRNAKPKRVGSYAIGATLGKGSFGTVKVGTHVDTGVEYALKFLSKRQVTDISEVERLFRESAILTAMKCDNVIRLYQVIDEPNHIVMVMELARGGDLLDLIKSRMALPEREACRLFQEIVSGVEYCHKKEIVHRDLKLENILLVNGKVKIADFGLSNNGILGKREMGTACGTPSYLAPEQISRDAGSFVGSQADIWAMGVILYAMVAGFLPFQAKNTPTLFKRILNLEFGYPDYISDELRDLVGRMLTPEPDGRATVAEIKSHPWYLMDLNDDVSDRPVTAEMVRQARDKLNERATPSSKPISRKPSENCRSSSSSTGGSNPSSPSIKSTKAPSPLSKRVDSAGLPPVPNAGKAAGATHQRVASSSQPPRLKRGSSNTSSSGGASNNGSGVGQFRMRPGNQRLGSMADGMSPTSTPKPAGMARIRSYARTGDLDLDLNWDDGADHSKPTSPTPVVVIDRNRPLPKLVHKKSAPATLDDAPNSIKSSEY